MSAVYLVRHGQASFGAADYDRLSERGEQQARVLGSALAHLSPRIGVLASGGMLRHRQTAQACLQAMGHPAEWQVDAGWNEFDHVAVIGLDEGRFPSARSVNEAVEPERALEEERRLAYVAWTRARRSLTLVYDPGAPSQFLMEAFDAVELAASSRAA